MYNTHKMTNEKETVALVSLVKVPTLAGGNSREAPVLLVKHDKAAKVAAEILKKDEERKQHTSS